MKPKYYIKRVVYCDDCKVELIDTVFRTLVIPPEIIFKCPKCGRNYYLEEEEIRDYWEYEEMKGENQMKIKNKEELLKK